MPDRRPAGPPVIAVERRTPARSNGGAAGRGVAPRALSPPTAGALSFVIDAPNTQNTTREVCDARSAGREPIDPGTDPAPARGSGGHEPADDQPPRTRVRRDHA